MTTTHRTTATPQAFALAYARMGWPVLPLRPGSKVPATARGFKDATTDPERIRRLFKAGAGVGIHPGPAHLLVLDLDDKNGKSGSLELDALELVHGALPATLTQHTPSGGRHLVFSVPDGLSIGNAELAPGIDIRSAAGYIAAAPTVLDSGKGYRLEGWDALASDAPPVAPAPPWLLALLTHSGKETPRGLGGTHAAPAASTPGPAPGDDLADMVPADTVDELRAALAYLVERGKADPDDYGQWVAMGERLRCAGDEGRALWLAFGARSPKFDEAAALAKWDTFKPERTGYAAIFKEAQAAGWVNPRSKAAQVASASETQRGPGGTFSLFQPAPGTSTTPPGVYFVGVDKDGDDLPPRWLCAPLRILAATRGAKSADWGRLLEWADADGRPHRWAVPAELLAGDGLDVRRELMRLGLAVSPNRQARDLLSAYLQSWHTPARARCVDRLGWLGPVYVLPDEAIGAGDEAVVFQSASAIEPAFAQAGTVEGWRDNVAALAQGNGRMVFAICCAFAPVLAHLVGEDSGGFHLRGKSSSGKSTALHLAASVWGHPRDFPRLWRATANGLEGLAAMHNDCLLILDELSQADPREAGEAAYMLSNGQGKTRATRAGMARPAARWRLLFLSAGEEGLADMMNRAGKRANAGQEVRLADIEADAGAGLGAFDHLKGWPTGAALSLALKDAAAQHHGAVGLEWLRLVVRDRPALADRVGERVRAFVAQHVPADAPGQVVRVARRFGLVAAAGELATAQGLTGWPEGEATASAGQCFASWLSGFGATGSREDRALLAQVRAFFEAHGASRFEDMSAIVEQRVPNRAGFWRTTDAGGREFLVLPEVFRRELCAGFDPKAAARALLDAGVILAGEDGKTSRKVRLPGFGTSARVYVFTAALWDSGD